MGGAEEDEIREAVEFGGFAGQGEGREGIPVVGGLGGEVEGVVEAEVGVGFEEVGGRDLGV